MSRHIVISAEEFTRREQARAEAEGGWALHPDNRLTYCGRRISNLSVTTIEAHGTCKTCVKKSAAPYGRSR